MLARGSARRNFQHYKPARLQHLFRAMDRQIASLDPNVNPVPLPIMAISGPSYPPRHHPHLGRGLMNPNPDSDRGSRFADPLPGIGAVNARVYNAGNSCEPIREPACPSITRRRDKSIDATTRRRRTNEPSRLLRRLRPSMAVFPTRDAPENPAASRVCRRDRFDPGKKRRKRSKTVSRSPAGRRAWPCR